MLRTDDSNSQFKDEWFLKKSVWTFCPTKTEIVQTNVNFGRKMSDVRPLFQALCIVYLIYIASYICITQTLLSNKPVPL